MRTKWAIVVTMALLGLLAVGARAQMTKSTFHGFKGDTLAWTDEIMIEEGSFDDNIEGVGTLPDREATTRPGVTTGEIFNESANGLPAHRVVVKGEYVTIYDGQGMTGMVMLEGSPLVFDPTIPSHYGILLGRYDERRGGAQKIQVIIPEMGDYRNIEITPRPAVRIQVGQASKEAKVYQFRLDAHQYAMVWTLDDAVAAVHLPSKDETMVDTKYPMLHQEIKAFVKRPM